MTAAEFAAQWGRAPLSERSSSQQHFLDLCGLVGHPKPAEIDPTGDFFWHKEHMTNIALHPGRQGPLDQA
ncbi:MAG: hypothetical protein WEB60_11270 [Terrimicrobiaceae bacterium]